MCTFFSTMQTSNLGQFSFVIYHFIIWLLPSSGSQSLLYLFLCRPSSLSSNCLLIPFLHSTLVFPVCTFHEMFITLFASEFVICSYINKIDSWHVTKVRTLHSRTSLIHHPLMLFSFSFSLIARKTGCRRYWFQAWVFYTCVHGTISVVLLKHNTFPKIQSCQGLVLIPRICCACF